MYAVQGSLTRLQKHNAKASASPRIISLRTGISATVCLPCSDLTKRDRFLTLWKDADPDIAVLKEAKAEYAKLQ